jgi:hypothetical protein
MKTYATLQASASFPAVNPGVKANGFRPNGHEPTEPDHPVIIPPAEPPADPQQKPRAVEQALPVEQNLMVEVALPHGHHHEIGITFTVRDGVVTVNDSYILRPLERSLLKSGATVAALIAARRRSARVDFSITG